MKKVLLSKSHIIPDFMYQQLYTDGHKLFHFAPKKFVEGDKRINTPSSGEYESNILCTECDNKILGQYESYARPVLYGGTFDKNQFPDFKSYITSAGIKYTYCRNLNYKKMKLFFLSILWRAGVSNRPFFHEIQLGDDEPIIRKMILEGNPSSAEQYPAIVLTFLNDKSFSSHLVSQPGKIPNDHDKRFVFIIDGMVYVFYLSRTVQDPILDEFVLKPNGDMKILHIPHGKGFGYIMNYFGIEGYLPEND
jgi:hypothetical protein